MQEDMKREYTVVYDQCTPRLKTQLEGTNTFETVKNAWDIIALITLIKGIVCKFDKQQQGVYSRMQAKTWVMTLYQGSKQLNSNYVEEVKAVGDVVESYSGTYWKETGLLQVVLATSAADPNNPTEAETTATKRVINDKFLAAVFISGADSG